MTFRCMAMIGSQPPPPHLPGQTGMPVRLYKFVGDPEFKNATVRKTTGKTLRHKPNREAPAEGLVQLDTRVVRQPYLISTLYSSHLLFSPALLTCSSHLLFRSSTYCNNHYFSSSSPDLLTTLSPLLPTIYQSVVSGPVPPKTV